MPSPKDKHAEPKRQTCYITQVTMATLHKAEMVTLHEAETAALLQASKAERSMHAQTLNNDGKYQHSASTNIHTQQ
jgi:hypothetical protein